MKAIYLAKRIKKDTSLRQIRRNAEKCCDAVVAELWWK